ncbi:MAG: Na/Pi cotransporter family protein [Lachnospiraceae bacterium]|nr:Na/Pi cotransporter family protein [Lachnospiraceae bacterium]
MIAVLELFGGVGLFLFGMSLMGASLEKLAGSGLSRILEALTTSRKKGVGSIKGWALGVGVTAIIQSSAATTIMLIGFVNAGIMKLSQSLPVVFGANVGSTVTAQILRLGDLGSDNLVLQLLKPAAFAPMLSAVGAFIYMFTKKRRLKDIAGILIGLGLLFYGMTMMEEVFAPLQQSERFRHFFTSFENPFIGILTGLVLTAIIQSSSASVGILQALSATGSVTYAIAVPIIIGQNIGKCFTIILAGIGANRKAKQVSLAYLLFNLTGAVLFTAVIYTIYYTFGIPSFSKVVNRGNIANIHLAFNLITSLILLPLCNEMSELTGRILKEDEASAVDKELQKLDPLLLGTPGIALQQSNRVINIMADKIMENFRYAESLIDRYEPEIFSAMQENESFIDRCETMLSDYVVKIDRRRLTNDNRMVVLEILNSVGDFERIGDYCINMAYVAGRMDETGLSFSRIGSGELKVITEATRHTLSTVIKAFAEDNGHEAARVEPLSDTIDRMKEIIKAHHVERLQEGTCTVEGGVALLDLINGFERMASHAANIALHIVKRTTGDKNFDEMHGHIYDSSTEEFQALRGYYDTKYIEPLMHIKDMPEETKETEETEEAKEEKPVEIITEPEVKKEKQSKKAKKDIKAEKETIKKSKKDKKEKKEKDKKK